MKSPTNTPSAGYINAAEIYTLPEIKRRLRLGRWSFRKLRQAGLQVIVVGRCSYVEGAAAIEALKAAAEVQADTAGKEAHP